MKERYSIESYLVFHIKIENSLPSLPNIRLATYANLFSLEADFLQTLAEYVKSWLAFKQNPEYFWSEFNIRSSKPFLDSGAWDSIINWSLHRKEGSKIEKESYPGGHLCENKRSILLIKLMVLYK